MGLVQHQEHDTGGNATIDINHVVRVLAERDGGHVPGHATFSFIRSIQHGVTGLATYLPDCSLAFLRRYPFFFVGRTEAMTTDWASLWRPRHAPALGHTHQFELPYPRTLLAPEPSEPPSCARATGVVACLLRRRPLVRGRARGGRSFACRVCASAAL